MSLSFWRMSFELLRESLRWREEGGAKLLPSSEGDALAGMLC